MRLLLALLELFAEIGASGLGLALAAERKPRVESQGHSAGVVVLSDSVQLSQAHKSLNQDAVCDLGWGNSCYMFYCARDGA